VRWDDGEVTLAPFYRKVALHEIGHLFGLNHEEDVIGPSSVMNYSGGSNDSRGLVSEVVTVCDRDAARNSALRTWQ
jgi:predicted Zn-dependent protease